MCAINSRSALRTNCDSSRARSDAHGPFLIETRVEGVSMRALADGWRSRGGVPAALLDHVCRGAIELVADLHELRDEAGPLGIVHGDIGPAHLYLGPIGQIGLIDFGAARFRGMSESLATADRGTEAPARFEHEMLVEAVKSHDGVNRVRV